MSARLLQRYESDPFTDEDMDTATACDVVRAFCTLTGPHPLLHTLIDDAIVSDRGERGQGANSYFAKILGQNGNWYESHAFAHFGRLSWRERWLVLRDLAPIPQEWNSICDRVQTHRRETIA